MPEDGLALTLDGSKRWPDARRLERFGVQRCQLTLPAARKILAEVADAVARVARDLREIAARDPGAGGLADRMRAAWAEGVASLTGKAAG
jgi:serine/threonine-protein kinase HipA